MHALAFPSEPLGRLPRYGEVPGPFGTPFLATALLGAGPAAALAVVVARHRRGELALHRRAAEVFPEVALETPLAFRHDLGLGDHEAAALERVHAPADVGVVAVEGPLPLGRRRRVGRVRRGGAAGGGVAGAALAVRVHDDELQAAVARVARAAARPARGRERRPQLELVVAREPPVVPRHVHLLRHEDGVPAVRQHRPEHGHRRHDGRQVHLERREHDALRPVERRVDDGIRARSVLDDGVQAEDADDVDAVRGDKKILR